MTKNDFFSKIKDKVSNVKEKIENELNNYLISELKTFLQKLTENEKLRDKIIEYIKKESETILENPFKNQNHFNALLLGKTGVGKSTLINGIFNFSQEEGEKTGVGKPITTEFNEYTSNERKGLKKNN